MLTNPGSEQVCHTILRIFRTVVGTEPHRGLDTTPDDVPDWNSLAQIRLLHAIEEHFGCLLDDRFLNVGPALAEFADATCAAFGTGDDR